MKRKLIFVLLILALVALPLCAACAEEVTPPAEGEDEGPPPAEGDTEANWWDALGEPEYGDTITVRVDSLNATFDGYYFRPGDRVAWMEPLFHPDWALDRETWPCNLDFSPPQYNQGLLAESFEMTDPQTIIVNIRQGVYWQDKAPVNGREFTAYDVEHHFQRQLALGGGYTQPSPMAPMLFSLIENVTATDDYTVVVELKKPSIVGLFQLVSTNPAAYIEAPEAVEAEGGSLTDWTQAVGTGAWMLTDFVDGSSMTLTANPNYWGYDERHPENQLPYADTLEYLLISDTAAALAAMRTGQVDVMTGVDWQQAIALGNTNPELQQSAMPSQGYALQMRVDNAPFTDMRVRQALQMSINLDAIASSIYGGTVDGTPVGHISPDYYGYSFAYEDWPQELKDEYAYNPTLAMQLLAEAAADGVFEPNDLGGFDTNIVAKTTDDLTLLQAVQSFFLDIGVDMEILTMDEAAMASYCQAGENDQMAYQNCAQVWAPSMTCTTYASGNVITNYTHNNDPDHDALTLAFDAATTEEEAAQAASALDRDALEQHWAVNLLPTVTYNICQPYIKGYSGEYLWWTAWFYYARMWVDQD